MPITLSSTYSSVVTLNIAGDDPATITATGLLSGGLAAKTLGQAWTIINAGQIHGQGAMLYSTGTVTNTGTIAGSNVGVYLKAGGTVTNASTGSITGPTEGVYGNGAAVTVSNAGYIAGPSSSGIKLNAGGSVSNSGTITGSSEGVIIGGGAGRVSNSNIIAGSQGVYLQAGGAVTNLSNGTITGGVYIYGGPGYVSNASLGLITARTGILMDGGAGTIINGGIVGGTSRGIFLRGGGSVTNVAGGTITGGNYGIFINGGTGAVSNAGSIAGSSYFGINLFSGGFVSNAATGSITGGHGGIYITGGAGTVSNDGHLIGTGNPSYGIKLNAGGTVTNTGSVTGVSIGILITSGAGTVGNTGRIVSTSNQGSAIALQLGGYVSNSSTGSISGSSKGIFVSGGVGTVTNAGSIASGASGIGIKFAAGGSIANVSGGSIAGNTGIVIGGGASTVTNAGTIGGGAALVGIQMSAGADGLVVNELGGSISGSTEGIFILTGGSISNASGGSITGGGSGIFVYNAAATITNGGVIAASNATSDGIEANAGVTVSNASGGSISGHTYGIIVAGAPGYISNTGSIVGKDAIYFSAGGMVANQSGGVIAGSQDGIFVAGGGATVTNGGSITGVTDAISFAGGNTNRLIIDPGASFTGTVQGGNAAGAGSVSTLELATGTATGTLTGLGTQFVDFAQITIDAGAYWTLNGANALTAGIDVTNAGTLAFQNATLTGAGSVANDGAIFIDPSSVTISALTGTGTVAIEAGSMLDVTGTVAGGQTIVFASSTGSLILSPTLFSGRIDGFQAGDTIDLSGVTDASSASIVNTNTLEVLRSGHPAIDLTLDTGRSFAGDTFGVTSSGILTTDAEAPCFLRGTLIRTDRGDVPVESLAIGALVRTLSGTLRPITWIGSGKVLVAPGKRSAATPIVVRKAALADMVPFGDLRITKGHSLYIDGVLIPAEFLVNHRTILWDDHRQHVEFYHIELATHDVLIANGAASESYRDDGNRWLFQNRNDAWDRTAQPPCAPVLTGGPVVDAIWRRLLERDHDRARMATTDDPDLHLLVDGVRVDAASHGATRVFRLTGHPRTVRIGSRAATPAETGLGRDSRSLGVAVVRVTLRNAAGMRVLEAASPALSDGFHPFEAELGLRWTDGDATLPPTLFDGFDGAIDLELRLGGSTQYPAHSEAVTRAA